MIQQATSTTVAGLSHLVTRSVPGRRVELRVDALRYPKQNDTRTQLFSASHACCGAYAPEVPGEQQTYAKCHDIGRYRAQAQQCSRQQGLRFAHSGREQLNQDEFTNSQPGRSSRSDKAGEPRSGICEQCKADTDDTNVLRAQQQPQGVATYH